MTDCSSLTGDAATVSDDKHVIFAQCFCQIQRLFNDQFECFQTEIFIDITFIDDNASFTRYEAYTCYRVLTTTCPIVLYLCHETVLLFN